MGNNTKVEATKMFDNVNGAQRIPVIDQEEKRKKKRSMVVDAIPQVGLSGRSLLQNNTGSVSSFPSKKQTVSPRQSSLVLYLRCTCREGSQEA